MSPIALCVSTIFGCFVGSLVPVINTELVVLGAAAAAPPELLLPLILIASTTQMAAKSMLYLAGSGVLRLPKGYLADHLDAALARVNERQATSGALLFASASTGFPPFYVVSVASGALRIQFKRFLVLGFLGRTVRFAVLILAPQLIKAVF